MHLTQIQSVVIYATNIRRRESFKSKRSNTSRDTHGIATSRVCHCHRIRHCHSQFSPSGPDSSATTVSSRRAIGKLHGNMRTKSITNSVSKTSRYFERSSSRRGFLSVSNPTYYGELWESHTQISPGPGGGHGPVHHNKFTIISSPPPIKLRVSKLHLRN